MTLATQAPPLQKNRYPGTCATCLRPVAAEQGATLRVDGKIAVLCAACAGPRMPKAPKAPAIGVTLSPCGRLVHFRPTGWLDHLFGAYHDAMSGSATYVKEDKRNEAPLGQLAMLSERLRVAGFALEVHPDVIAAAQAQDAQNAAHVADAQGNARVADEILRASGRSLMPFQAEGVAWLAPMSGAILGDEMGLGKTIQVLLAAPVAQGLLVVCPKVAKGVWSREAQRWRPGLRVTALAGRGSFRWPEPGELVITNYELLPGEADWPATIEACPAGVTLVADEGHMLKAGGGTRGSLRGRAFQALSKAARGRGGRAWIVTGSPQLNDHYFELRNLLDLVGQSGNVFGSYPQFLTLCGGHKGKYGIEWDPRQVDPSVPERLRRAMIRRRKADVLPQLPEKIVEIVDVALSREALRDLDREVKDARASGVDVLAAIDAARQSSKVRFDQFSRIREVLARAKVAHAIEMIEELEEAGEPVVVGSAHRGPIDALGARPGWAAITGDTGDAERQQIAEDFQAGKLRGVAGTIQAMGVAITLTRASEAIVIDPMATPELNRQFEDRIHRIGQGRTARIRYLRADHAVDAAVFMACETKDEFVNRTVNAMAIREAPAPAIGASAALAQASVTSDAEAAGDADEEGAQLEALLAQIRDARTRGDIAQLRQKSLQKAARAVASRGWAIPGGGGHAARTNAGSTAEDGPARGPQGLAECWAANAIVHLASACDGAATEDGVGFMKSDVALGHALAASVPYGLSDLEWAVAVQICQRYPRQVGRPESAE